LFFFFFFFFFLSFFLLLLFFFFFFFFFLSFSFFFFFFFFSSSYLRPAPARERVGREPRVHQSHVALKVRGGQVGEVLGDLRRQQLALVDDRRARQRAHERRVVPDPLGRQLVLDELAQDKVLRLRVWGGRHGLLRLREEALLDPRLGRLGAVAERGGVGRHSPPAQHRVPQLLRDLVDRGLGRLALARVRGEEEHPDGVVPRGGERLEAERSLALCDDAPEEALGDRDQAPGAVARVVLAATRAPVRHAHEHLERVGDARARRHARQFADEADAAGVLVLLRVVEAPGRRRRVVPCAADAGVRRVAPAGEAAGAPGRRGGGRGAELVGVVFFLEGGERRREEEIVFF